MILNHRFYGTWSEKLSARTASTTRTTRAGLWSARARGKEETDVHVHDRAPRPAAARDRRRRPTSTLLWWNALERTDGFLHWGFARFLAPRKGATRPRNPYDDPLSWTNGSLVERRGAPDLPGRLARDGLDDPMAAVARAHAARRRARTSSAPPARASATPRSTRELGRIFGRVRTVRCAGYTWPRYSRRAADYELGALRDRGDGARGGQPRRGVRPPRARAPELPEAETRLRARRSLELHRRLARDRRPAPSAGAAGATWRRARRARISRWGGAASTCWSSSTATRRLLVHLRMTGNLLAASRPCPPARATSGRARPRRRRARHLHGRAPLRHLAPALDGRARRLPGCPPRARAGRRRLRRRGAATGARGGARR